MITVRNLNKKFGKIRAIKDLNMKVTKGRVHGLVGPEASGKSTVLRIISTLIRPDSGEVNVDGYSLEDGTQVRRIIGFVPKTPHLPLDATARELVTFAASLQGIRDTNIISSTLKKTGLDAVADQTLHRYSENMRKNVAIAMALVHNPQVLLLDEPMNGLDPISRRKFKEFIHSSNKTVLITGPDLNSIEGLCHSVTVLMRGSVIVDDELASLRQKMGKGALEIKLYDFSQTQKLLFELEKQGAKTTVSGESIYVKFNSDAEVPRIIRICANAADIMEAKSVKISIDDIFSQFHHEEVK